jgi:hypothetical protein
MCNPNGATPSEFSYVLADSIAFLNPANWDEVAAPTGLFLSRPFLKLLEENLPENLSVHYAIVYEKDRPVALVAAQSLEIRVANLSSKRLPEVAPRFWRSLGEASQRTISRVRRRVLLYENLLLWPFREEAVEEAAEGHLSGESWPDVAVELWRRLRRLLSMAERAAEFPMTWIRLRFLVCGNLLSTGPHGFAFAEGQDPVRLWPAVVEALYRIRKSSTLFGESDMIMIKDLTDEQGEALEGLRHSSFRRFETEPNMLLPLKPSWTSFEDFLKDMRSVYRKDIKRALRALEASGVVLERIGPDRVKAEASTIYRLYQQVHDHQKLRLVGIREGWIPALAGLYKDDFRTVVAHARDGGPILGFITLIRDGENAVGYNLGFDKTVAGKGHPLYMSLVYAGVGQAIQMGASRLVLGRTALGPKAQIGGKAQPMFGYVRHRSSTLNLAVPGILALLPAPDQPPKRHPFKE